MDIFKRYWKNVPSAVRKPLILIIGTFFIILGLILLPLPGPGWLVIFLGFAVLATEFAAAEKVRAWMVGQLKTLADRMRDVWIKFRRQAK